MSLQRVYLRNCKTWWDLPAEHEDDSVKLATQNKYMTSSCEWFYCLFVEGKANVDAGMSILLSQFKLWVQLGVHAVPRDHLSPEISSCAKNPFTVKIHQESSPFCSPDLKYFPKDSTPSLYKCNMMLKLRTKSWSKSSSRVMYWILNVSVAQYLLEYLQQSLCLW